VNCILEKGWRRIKEVKRGEGYSSRRIEEERNQEDEREREGVGTDLRGEKVAKGEKHQRARERKDGDDINYFCDGKT
jgi:hypothetical protein